MVPLLFIVLYPICIDTFFFLGGQQVHQWLSCIAGGLVSDSFVIPDAHRFGFLSVNSLTRMHDEHSQVMFSCASQAAIFCDRLSLGPSLMGSLRAARGLRHNDR